MAVGYRNSIGNDALYLNFTKAGYWFTGPWGKDFDSLIRTGLFSDEMEVISSQQNQMNDSFYSAEELVDDGPVESS